jgi:hypothetical protein
MSHEGKAIAHHRRFVSYYGSDLSMALEDMGMTYDLSI